MEETAERNIFPGRHGFQDLTVVERMQYLSDANNMRSLFLVVLWCILVIFIPRRSSRQLRLDAQKFGEVERRLGVLVAIFFTI